eukprot:7578313-Alexandrium_andersonii.AAC.1
MGPWPNHHGAHEPADPESAKISVALQASSAHTSTVSVKRVSFSRMPKIQLSSSTWRSKA